MLGVVPQNLRRGLSAPARPRGTPVDETAEVDLGGLGHGLLGWQVHIAKRRRYGQASQDGMAILLLRSRTQDHPVVHDGHQREVRRLRRQSTLDLEPGAESQDEHSVCA